MKLLLPIFFSLLFATRTGETQAQTWMKSLGAGLCTTDSTRLTRTLESQLNLDTSQCQTTCLNSVDCAAIETNGSECFLITVNSNSIGDAIYLHPETNPSGMYCHVKSPNYDPDVVHFRVSSNTFPHDSFRRVSRF